MPCLAAHGHDQVPARRRLGVNHQVLDQLDAHVPRGLEAEGGNAVRQVEVVVDGLRHVDDAQTPAGVRCQAHRREGGVVAADRDQLVDTELLECARGRLEVAWIPGRVGARDPEVRAAREVDATHRFDGQRQGTAGVALHQPFETVTNPDHADAAHQRTNGGRANHAVDAWRGATAAQDPYALRISHKATASMQL